MVSLLVTYAIRFVPASLADFEFLNWGTEGLGSIGRLVIEVTAKFRIGVPLEFRSYYRYPVASAGLPASCTSTTYRHASGWEPSTSVKP